MFITVKIFANGRDVQSTSSPVVEIPTPMSEQKGDKERDPDESS